MFPDVSVVAQRIKSTSSPVGVAAITAPVLMTTDPPVAVPVYRLAIRDRKKRQLVTAIEILSPVNKIGVGRRKYLRKRGALLQSDVHLLEIDLSRHGKRLPANEPLPAAWYYVLLHRENRRPVTEVWPIQLAERLPTIPVPLRETDADVLIDLQVVFTDVYDNCGVGDAIDYRDSLEVPLSPEEKTWVTKLLKKSGKR